MKTFNEIEPRTATRYGAMAFLTGTALVHVGNYAFNLLAVRWLTPAEYADVALAVTMLLLAGFVTVGFQMATARTVGELGSLEAAAGIAAWFRARAFRAGAVLGLAVTLASPKLAVVFQTTSEVPFVAVGLALPFAFSAGVGRGFWQGLERFWRLAASFQVEMLVRLGMGAGLMVAGLGVAGGVGGLALSVMAAAMVVLPAAGHSTPADPGLRRRLVATLWPTCALLVGEALINHADTVIVKHAFDPTTAGQFAAVALLGRAVFFVTWPISMVVFPIATRRAAAGHSTGPLLATAVGAVAAVGAIAVAVTGAFGPHIVRLVLGPGYLAQAPLLAPYVLATSLFACAATILSFRLAVGFDGAGYGAAGAGVLLVLALSVFHPSPHALVWIQVVLMGIYLVLAAAVAFRDGAS